MFQLVEIPLALPGQCYLCGSADKAPYIDWGVSIEFYGALYTCHECTGAVASLLGWVSMGKHQEVLKTIEELRDRNFELEIQNSALKQAIESLQIAGMMTVEPISDSNVEPPGSIADLDSDLLEDSQDVDESTRNSDEFLDFGKRTSDESSNDKGMDKLHSNESGVDFKLTL